MISGLIGVPLGSLIAQRLRAKYQRIDPLICALGLIVSSPLIFIASLVASVNTNLCYALIFFGEIFLNLNWSIVADILLVSVVFLYYYDFTMQKHNSLPLFQQKLFSTMCDIFNAWQLH